MGKVYEINAFCTRVIDGDTIECDFDLFFDLPFQDQHVRFAGLNAPEKSTEQGKVVTELIKSRLEKQNLTLKVYKKGKYGRWIADVYLRDEHINEWMIKRGYAEPAIY